MTRVNLTEKYPHCSKRQQRRYAMQEGRRLLKLYKAGKLSINEVRDGVGLPRVANGGDNYFAICEARGAHLNKPFFEALDRT